MIPDESTTSTSEDDNGTSTQPITSTDTVIPPEATRTPTTTSVAITTTSIPQTGEYTPTSVIIPTENDTTSRLQTTVYPTSGLTTAEPGPVTTTFVIGSLTTKTYIITTTTALVLLVTDTQTFITVSTVTYSSAVVDYSTSTLVSPISTSTSTVNFQTGYHNRTLTEASLVEFTEFTSFISTYQFTRYSTSLNYITQIYEEIVTSTLIVWGTEVTESFTVSSGYQTLVSTIYPETQIATLTSSADTVISISTITESDYETPTYVATTTTTHTYTVTVSPVLSEGVISTPNICSSVAQTSASAQIHVESVYSGDAEKVGVKFNWAYVAAMMFALLH